MTDYQEVRTTQHEQGRGQRVATFKATQIIWLVLGFIEAMLALRVVFKLIAVNPSNPFASLLYSVTDLLVAPFVSLVGSPAAAGMVLEISSIIAMLVYLLIGWGLVQMVNVLFYRPRGPVVSARRQRWIASPRQSPKLPVRRQLQRAKLFRRAQLGVY